MADGVGDQGIDREISTRHIPRLVAWGDTLRPPAINIGAIVAKAGHFDVWPECTTIITPKALPTATVLGKRASTSSGLALVAKSQS